MTDTTPVAQKEEKKATRSPDPGNLMLLLYTTLLLLFICWGGIAHAETANQEKQGEVRFDDIRQGELLLSSAGGVLPAIHLSQEVKMQISGIVARVTVAQKFCNTGSEWLDGIYVFPLPDESAVDRLRMRVGEREIVGEIKERAQARAIYEQARNAGKKSSLLMQNRPNIFTTRVANIGPGETVVIEIGYQQVVRYADEVFSLRFPMVVGPRYIPGAPLIRETPRDINFSLAGWAADTDQVADGSQITPPVTERAVNPVRLSVELASGFSLARLESLYHGIAVEEKGKGRYQLHFTGEVKADRDFVLEWQPERTSDTSAALFAERQGDDHYLLLMLLPPQAQPQEYLPREVIFILDVSGSMAGSSIIQAQEALRLALSNLRPTDRFNLITFNDSAHQLFSQPQYGEPAAIAKALSHVAQLKGDGGTEMAPPLRLALDGLTGHDRIRQVLFLTDGAVGNEQQLFGLINDRLGDSRLFTVGIGSAPNSYFMSRAATMGRGTYTFIGKMAEVGSKMAELFSKLESPVMADITLADGDGEELAVESYPAPIPDLYQGEPLVLAMRLSAPLEAMQISGKRQGKMWRAQIDTTTYGSRPGIAALWARKKIRSEMTKLALGGDPQAVRQTVLQTALAHQLVSKYTSLVAVDKTVSRPPGQTVRKAAVPTKLPQGWQMDKIFGGTAQTATPSTLYCSVGAMLLVFGGVLLLVRRRAWHS